MTDTVLSRGQQRRTFGMALAGVAVLLVTSGCNGSGLANLFGFWGSDSSEVVRTLALSESGSGDGSGGDTIATRVATVHNPEPASMVLFGGGAAGLAVLRRRRKSKRSAAR